MKTEIKINVAANITYSGFTYNTPLIVEYAHTGKQWFYKVGKKTHFTECEDIAKSKIDNGIKVTEKPGYFFIKRIAILTKKSNGCYELWYINNAGDEYKINKASKYWRKIHEMLSNNIIPNQIKQNEHSNND